MAISIVSPAPATPNPQVNGNFFMTGGYVTLTAGMTVRCDLLPAGGGSSLGTVDPCPTVTTRTGTAWSAAFGNIAAMNNCTIKATCVVGGVDGLDATVIVDVI